MSGYNMVIGKMIDGKEGPPQDFASFICWAHETPKKGGRFYWVAALAWSPVPLIPEKKRLEPRVTLNGVPAPYFTVASTSYIASEAGGEADETLFHAFATAEALLEKTTAHPPTKGPDPHQRWLEEYHRLAEPISPNNPHGLPNEKQLKLATKIAETRAATIEGVIAQLELARKMTIIKTDNEARGDDETEEWDAEDWEHLHAGGDLSISNAIATLQTLYYREPTH